MAYKCIKAEDPGVEGIRQKEKIYITQSAEALKLIKFFWMELGITAKPTSERGTVLSLSPAPQEGFLSSLSVPKYMWVQPQID